MKHEEVACAGAASTTTVAGDLSITSKLIMNDVTAGKILVGDGSSYEEVAVSGDATLASNGAVTLAGAQTVSSTLGVTGATTLSSTLGVRNC